MDCTVLMENLNKPQQELWNPWAQQTQQGWDVAAVTASFTRARTECALQVVLKRHKHEQGKPWPAYTPCQCVGGCGASCPCLKSKNFCEKFCGCSPAKCGIRFQGCDCKSGCRSKTCPCFAAGTVSSPSCLSQLSALSQVASKARSLSGAPHQWPEPASTQSADCSQICVLQTTHSQRDTRDPPRLPWTYTCTA